MTPALKVLLVTVLVAALIVALIFIVGSKESKK